MIRASALGYLLVIATVLQPAGNRTAWPGLWGPHRNAIGSGSLPAPVTGTKVLWRRPVDGGYSEVVVSRGRAYTMELRDGDDFIVALDANTGTEFWSVRVGPTYKGHNSSDDGPISTPAIEGNDLFALGPHGHLIAVDIARGRERWRHHLAEDFSASKPNWGFGASPLIAGRLVIVPTGGPESRGLLAFERATGRLVWSSAVTRGRAYASAVAATLAGVPHIIAVAPDRAYAVSPTDGRELWSVPGPGGGVETRNTPIVLPDDRVLVTHWEEAIMLKVTRTRDRVAVTELWRSPRLRSAHGPTVFRDGFLYGFAGPQLVCLDAATGDVQWRERTGPGMLIAVGNRLVVLGEDTGTVTFGVASPNGFAAEHAATVLEPGIRAFTGPSFADGSLFVRNVKQIVAFQTR